MFTLRIRVMLSAAAMLLSVSTLQAQQPQAARTPQISRELWQILSDWAEGSARIKLLSGKHERHVYDHTFCVEKVSNGEFWYEAPDKGRIDITEVKISPEMLARRQQPEAKVERNPKTNEPYQLKSDDPRRWICDGSRVFDIDDPGKTAHVVQLPPNVRGENIMNSPLPFLFGLPPEKATERFTMTLVEGDQGGRGYVLLQALPRLAQDANNWQKAMIYLDTKSWLPLAVRLLDPAGTQETTYKFMDVKINKAGILPKIIGGSPWEPNIRGYDIKVMEPGADGQVARAEDTRPAMPPQNVPNANRTPPAVTPGVVPNVIGQPHHIATQTLIQAGFKEADIRKFKGEPAPNSDQKYVVSKQNPAPGTRIEPGAGVQLLIYTEPQVGVVPASEKR
ncbi:MAG: PASTA domain-containing protein [Planctomycetaceae bacterium]